MYKKLNNDKIKHTVICGEANYEQMLRISNQIEINIIKLDITVTNVDEYSKLLMSIDFWNKLKGDKILIYQHDTWVFHSNYINFLQYDYIGAPWISQANITSKNIGNGGFSLRDRIKMIDILILLAAAVTALGVIWKAIISPLINIYKKISGIYDLVEKYLLNLGPVNKIL
jgi:hypothetical protein